MEPSVPKSIRVNADYELALFTGKAGARIINESIEFLALFLDERPLYSQKSYAPEYLRHVENLTQRVPRVTSKGPFENWWGQLVDLPKERLLNSKEIIAPFSPETTLVSVPADFRPQPGTQYLLKSPHGMSGQNFHIWNPETPLETLSSMLERSGKLIAEPLLPRHRDFSHYVLSPREVICYQNLVDDRFQYRGTLFSNLQDPAVSSLSFYSEVRPQSWEQFQAAFEQIRSFVADRGIGGGYCVDSFSFFRDGKIFLRTITEINYRKTMGLIAWLLSQRLAGTETWSLFFLVRPPKLPDVFGHINSRVREVPGLFYLSPGDTRFEVFLLTAPTAAIGWARLEDLRALLPDCELPVQV